VAAPESIKRTLGDRRAANANGYAEQSVAVGGAAHRSTHRARGDCNLRHSGNAGRLLALECRPRGLGQVPEVLQVAGRQVRL
jgi:hypothetical protein